MCNKRQITRQERCTHNQMDKLIDGQRSIASILLSPEHFASETPKGMVLNDTSPTLLLTFSAQI